MLLVDSLRQLCCCLEEKHLNHLLFSKKRVPEEMVLPPAFCRASLLNLSQCLTQEPAAHAQALHEFEELQDWPTRLLISRY